ncbi:MAG: ribonuclease HII [Bacteroidales bacterium]|nr:ribonuclease HII [Bacteroidales bacterium]
MLLPYLNQGIIECGVDEAGRGCLAGPVVAAAVILPEDFVSEFINDSKQLTPKKRDELRPVIEKYALAWNVCMIDNRVIDEKNILQATYDAMHGAINGLNIRPEHIIVDGNRFRPFEGIDHTTIVKGDGKYMSIAAASILAKTHRDEYMLEQHKIYPVYAWDKNKGYPTAAHCKGLAEYGTSPLHRLTFQKVKQ